MMKLKGLIIVLLICIGHSFTQEYVPIDPDLVISAHENELGHGIHSRHPFWKMHKRSKSIAYPLLVMSWGEAFHYYSKN